jgi:hypothetical protein
MGFCEIATVGPEIGLYHMVLSDTPEIRSLSRALIEVRRTRYPSVKNNNHHASIPAQGIAVMMVFFIVLAETKNSLTPCTLWLLSTRESLFMKQRSNRARTSLLHLHQDHIQASAADFGLWSVDLPRYVSNRKAQRRGAQADH